MVLVNSTMLELGTEAPNFSLPDAAGGGIVSLAQAREGKRALVVMFICNHCPFVVYLADAMADLAREYAAKGVGFVAISSNSIESHPDDAPDKMRREAELRGYEFPYLYDESQEIAKSYRAACTPDFYVFGADARLVYRGRFDESRPGTETPITGSDLRGALDACLGGLPSVEPQLPSAGCNIKWKPGNEPDYFG